MTARMPPWVKETARLLRDAGLKWKRDRADIMAAALAYYSAFSLAPLVMLAVAVASLRIGAQASQKVVLHVVDALAGPRGADAVRPMVESANRMRHGGWATAISAAMLLYGGSTLLVHLQTALNVIFAAPARRQGHWLWRYLRRRLLSLALVAALPLVTLFTPALSAWLGMVGRSQVATVVVALTLESALFAFLFKVLPDVSLPWDDVWAGAVFTASIFTVCQVLLGFYLNRVASRSFYGAAGSLVAMLVWIHVSVQIVLFGAEFVDVYRRN